MNKSNKDILRIIDLLRSSFDTWFPEGWYLTGSTYLVNKGYLDRSIHDIDIMTKADHYADISAWDDQILLNLANRGGRSSGKFKDDEGNIIKCYKLSINGTVIDIMYNPSSSEDNILDQIIKYKVNAAKDDNREDQNKHLKDLLRLALNPECNEIIKKYYK